MAKRKIIEIDEEKCDGCGQCVVACAEGALQIIDGKAKVVNEVFCDGLGACIGECPEGALTIVERDAPEFDEAAVREHLAREGGEAPAPGHARVHAVTEPCGCPSANPMVLRSTHAASEHAHHAHVAHGDLPPELTNWPVQWKLVQPASPFFRGADVLISADCVPFAFRDFHGRFLAGRPVVIGCPKLDEQGPYLEKLTALLEQARPRSVTVVHMEVPCCSGLMRMVEEAIGRSGTDIPVKKVVVGIKGDVLEEV